MAISNLDSLRKIQFEHLVSWGSAVDFYGKKKIKTGFLRKDTVALSIRGLSPELDGLEDPSCGQITILSKPLPKVEKRVKQYYERSRFSRWIQRCFTAISREEKALIYCRNKLSFARKLRETVIQRSVNGNNGVSEIIQRIVDARDNNIVDNLQSTEIRIGPQTKPPGVWKMLKDFTSNLLRGFSPMPQTHADEERAAQIKEEISRYIAFWAGKTYRTHQDKLHSIYNNRGLTREKCIAAVKKLKHERRKDFETNLAKHIKEYGLNNRQLEESLRQELKKETFEHYESELHNAMENWDSKVVSFHRDILLEQSPGRSNQKTPEEMQLSLNNDASIERFVLRNIGPHVHNKNHSEEDFVKLKYGLKTKIHPWAANVYKQHQKLAYEVYNNTKLSEKECIQVEHNLLAARDREFEDLAGAYVQENCFSEEQARRLYCELKQEIMVPHEEFFNNYRRTLLSSQLCWNQSALYRQLTEHPDHLAIVPAGIVENFAPKINNSLSSQKLCLELAFKSDQFVRHMNDRISYELDALEERYPEEHLSMIRKMIIYDKYFSIKQDVEKCFSKAVALYHTDRYLRQACGKDIVDKADQVCQNLSYEKDLLFEKLHGHRLIGEAKELEVLAEFHKEREERLKREHEKEIRKKEKKEEKRLEAQAKDILELRNMLIYIFGRLGEEPPTPLTQQDPVVSDAEPSGELYERNKKELKAQAEELKYLKNLMAYIIKRPAPQHSVVKTQDSPIENNTQTQAEQSVLVTTPVSILLQNSILTQQPNQPAEKTKDSKMRKEQDLTPPAIFRPIFIK